MTDGTAIEWTHRPGTKGETWNPIAGCSVLSPGCTNCYAMKMAYRITLMGTAPHYIGTTKPTNGGPAWTGKIAVAPDHILLAPLRWKKPRTVFVNSMSDLFHPDVPDDVIDRVFTVMALAPQHTFQVLTKRAARMRTYVDGMFARREMLGNLMQSIGGPDREGWYAPECDGKRGWVGICLPLPNVWLGVSAERQREANERIPDLLATPAAIRFVSAEPLLGQITFRWAKWDDWRDAHGRRRSVVDHLDGLRRLDWIIVGGESGPNARPMHPDWVRSIRDHCAAAGTAFFFKQWGEHLGGTGDDSGDGVWFEAASRDADSRWLKNSDTFGWFDLAEAPAGPMHLKVGKKAAGRMLDGSEHSQFPELPEVPFR